RGKPLSMLIIDIDHFKWINDTYGHNAGDDVLREFSDRLRSCIRGIDLACRYGGEEFVVVMPDTDLGVANKVAERIRRSIAGEPFAICQGQPGDRGHDFSGPGGPHRPAGYGRPDHETGRRRPLSSQARRP